jgi:NAD-dependent deacetylase
MPVDRARFLCVLTGAGVSADSGLATFRGAVGLWEGVRIEDVATPEAWRADPALVWRFYQERRAALQSVEPNDAHRALAEFERRAEATGAGFLLVTQNVDDLHERAGSRRPVHVHGELARLRCERCGLVVVDREHLDPAEFVPCPRCAHARLRPDVVWFGEIPRHLDEVAERLASCSHFLAVGTSGVVWPAAGFLAEARGCGARTLVQALEAPENLAPQDRYVPGRAAAALPGLLAEILAEWGCSATDARP